MLDYIELCRTVPCDERCSQVGSEKYLKNARIEAKVYLNQLRRVLGANPIGSFFRNVLCPHEVGAYLDLKFYFDMEDQRHVNYMNKVEVGCKKWDKIAKKELDENDYGLEINSKTIKL